MSDKHYSAEKAAQILISLLKGHGIKRVIASPGTTNLSFVGSIQNDPFFEIYSAADERSAAYMACGMAAENGEPVVLSCTGATASRNYMPGLTEAYYRKLPILAVTANSGLYNNGQLVAQYIDRTVVPNDVTTLSVSVPAVHDDKTAWAANVDINRAILQLRRNGGGPAHINFSNEYLGDFSIKELPKERIIERIMPDDKFPILPQGRIGIFIGTHKTMSESLTLSIDKFCALHNAVVICDHSSGYYGSFRTMSSIILAQTGSHLLRNFDCMIHIGEMSGDYYSIGCSPRAVWRVSPDGEVRDFFHTLRYVFEMDEESFFDYYAITGKTDDSYLIQCQNEAKHIYSLIPELPFSNIWLAKESSMSIPNGSILHLGILNSLRAWNFFPIPTGVESYCNVGGFGIDGIMSTVIGASLVSKQKLFFCVLGDLAFFYDLNSIANRHVGSNLRIMLINNGKGTEFTNYGHLGHYFGEEANPYIAAAGHYGNKSERLIRHFATDLGFEYLTASNKEQYKEAARHFFTPEELEKPIIFEVFTDSKDESDALKIMLNLLPAEEDRSIKSSIKGAVAKMVGDKGRKIINVLREK